MKQIFVIRQLNEKYTEMNRSLYNNSIDFEQAFDSVWQEGLWRVMRHCGVLEERVELIEDIYSKSRSALRVEGELMDWTGREGSEAEAKERKLEMRKQGKNLEQRKR